MTKDLEKRANEFVLNARAQWRDLVIVARAIRPDQRSDAARSLSQAAGVGKTTLLRKLEALHLAMKDGLADTALIEMGQAKVLGKYVRDKKNGRQDEQVTLKWMVAPELRDGVHEQFHRIAKLLNMTTSNEVWTFVLSQLSQASDEELRHAAGEIR